MLGRGIVGQDFERIPRFQPIEGTRDQNQQTISCRQVACVDAN
jgi:hypothetical protein